MIDVLYKRWGSLPTFQRTRGVLRTLALVVHSLKNSKIPFIRLGDIDLSKKDIRWEFIKHLGAEYESIISADITSPNSGSKKVDEELSMAYVPRSLGTKCATTIFMCSFSGGEEKEASRRLIKLSTVKPFFESSSIIDEVIQKLRENLFYLYDSGLFSPTSLI